MLGFLSSSGLWSVRAAVYESTLPKPFLSNANVWVCPTSKVTEGAGAGFLFSYPYSIPSTDGAQGVGSGSPPIVIVVRSPASIVSR